MMMKRKLYTYPSGRVDTVQGFEPQGLDELIYNERVDENDIITSQTKVPQVWYIDPNNGKRRRYYIDIFIPKQNRCIEIKSAYTILLNKEVIFAKQQAVKDLGYECQIWVMSKSGEKLCVYE